MSVRLKKWFRTYSKWKPWTWIGEVRRLNLICNIKQAAYEKCCAQREVVERQRDNYRDKLAYIGLRWQMTEKRLNNMIEELNDKSNADLQVMDPEGKKIIETLDLPQLTHHTRVTQMGDWMKLEEYQKRAALPLPKLHIDTRKTDV